MENNKNVLITGSAGFIGKHAIETFKDSGFRVIGVDIKPMADSEGYKHYCLDINSPEFETVFQENEIHYVVHFAANSSVPYSVNNPLEDAETNYCGSIKLCALAKKYNIERMFAASTAALYAHPRYLPVKESHPPNCLSPYAITKQAMEYYIVLSGVNYTILRFSNVYGPGQNSKGEAGVISIFMDAMKANQPVKIFGDGKQIRDFVYVKDVVKAIRDSITNENCKNKIMNISSNTPTTINELFEELKTLFCYDREPEYLPERAGDIKASILDNTLAKQTFGFSPEVDFKTGIKMTIEALYR